MTIEHPRARRYPFEAKVDLTDLSSEARIDGRTSDVSLFGCHVDALKTFPQGTKVKIRIIHRSTNFEVLGSVAHVGPGGGMGIIFANMDLNAQTVLEKWIANIREQ